MDLTTLTDSGAWKTAAGIITGGAFVGWYRERRMGKKDAYGFAMDLLAQQSVRIDALVAEVAIIKTQFMHESSTVALLREENETLKMENIRLTSVLNEKNRENGGR